MKLTDRAPVPGGCRRREARWACLAVFALCTVASAQAFVAPELRAEAGRLLLELAHLRGLPPPGPAPRLVIQSREERRRFVVAELSRKYSPARLEAERRALIAWGLVPADFDLANFYADLLAEQAAAYYDPSAKRMVLANWLTPEFRRDAVTHELVHALQDRLVDLERFLGGASGRSDEGLARQALVEGEAVALSHDLALRRDGRDLAALPDVTDLQRAIRNSATGPVLARAPAYVRTMLTFPYAAGLGFVHAFRQQHAWAELSALYRDPPRSSSQILHPERYFERRLDPVPIPMAELGASLPTGSTLLLEDELGEVGLAEVLRQVPGGQTEAAGWRGDRYVLWSVPSSGALLVAVTVWDTEELAISFAHAYAGVLAAKRGLPPPQTDGPVVAWTVGAVGFAIERRTRTVLLVEGAPSAVIDGVRAAVWAKPVLY